MALIVCHALARQIAELGVPDFGHFSTQRVCTAAPYAPRTVKRPLVLTHTAGTQQGHVVNDAHTERPSLRRIPRVLGDAAQRTFQGRLLNYLMEGSVIAQ